MDLILLLGLVVLAISSWRLAARLKRLEDEIAGLGYRDAGPSALASEAAAAPRPAQAIRTEPARVVRSGSGDAPPAQDEVSAPKSPPEPPAVRETLATLFERFVGGRLLIWIGGVALAVAGIFLVRYSIEIGLITPPVRMIMAAVFGLVLVGAGELGRARAGPGADIRVGQALVGAGILVLYATAYGSYFLYGLLSLGTAAAVMVAITAAALILSLRHGPPTAMMGLAGGFLTPLLVGDPEAGAVPLLFYLALLDIALFALAQRRGWTWLAAAAAALSFVWTGSLLLEPARDALPAGLFVLVLSVAASLVRPGEGRHLPLLRPAAIGLLQLAVLVARLDLGLPAWGLFGLLALASLFLSTRREEFRLLPAVALVLALLLLAGKALTGADPLVPAVAAAITALFGGFALMTAVRGSHVAMWTGLGAAAFAGPAIILRAARPDLLARPAWAGLFILLAAGPAFLAWSRRAKAGRDGLLVTAAGAALLLLGFAAFDLVPAALLGAAWLALAAATSVAGRRLKDEGVTILALAAAAVAIAWVVAAVPDLWVSIGASVAGDPALVTGLPSARDAVQNLVLPALLLLLVWRLVPDAHPRLRQAVFTVTGIFGAGAAYIVFKQVFALAGDADFVARGFAERMAITQAIFLAGWLLGAGKVRLPWIDETLAARIGTVLTALAAARLVWFDMLIHNPVLDDQHVGALPIFNLLLPAYLLSAFWLYGFRRRAGRGAVSGVWLTLFLAALTMGTMLLVRQIFQGPILTALTIPASESYAYSMAGLMLSVGLLLAGVRIPDKALRFAGLVLLTATIVKVFLIDAAALEGLLRILSFLVLGIALIGIGKLYAVVLGKEASATPSPPAPAAAGG